MSPGDAPGTSKGSLPNQSHIGFWLFYPLTLLECAAMALAVALVYLLLRIFYSRWLYPNSARTRAPSRVKKSMDSEQALRAMRIVEQIAAESGARVFWISGTLLGLERNGRPLPHDNDLDLGICIFDPQCPEFIRALQASDSVVEMVPQMISWKIKMQNPDLQHVPQCIIRYKAAVRPEGGHGNVPVKIDVFLHFPYRNGLMHGTRNSLWWNSSVEFAQKTYGPNALSVPQDAHRYLLENYGDYRKEVRDFENSIDCPNAMNIFSWTSLGYLVSRLQLLIKLGRIDRARQVNARIVATIRKGMYPFDARA
jgi:hypothetical protein